MTEYAFSTVENALSFADKLANVSLRPDPETSDDAVLRRNDLDRVAEILKLLCDETPVTYATLWKLKSRANHASAISARDENRPNPPYVVPIDSTIFRTILEMHDAKMVEEPGSSGRVSIPDLAVLQTDETFFTDEIKQNYAGSKLIAVPFSFPHRSEWVRRPYPNFLLNMLIPRDMQEGGRNWIPSEIFNAITGKLLSGVAALIDRRMTRIAQAMTSITVAKSNQGAAAAMTKALREVVQRHIQCEGVLRIEPSTGGQFELAMNWWPWESRGARPVAMPDEAVQILGRFAEKRFRNLDAKAERDQARADSDLPGMKALDRLKDELAPAGAGEVRSLLLGRIHDRAEPNRPRGYIILLNRLNDLATMADPVQLEADYFDWEDELYLNHMCAVLDLITELFTAEETRLSRLHILAHEIQSPNGFIYATAERLHDEAVMRQRETLGRGRSSGRREPMPLQMQVRELDDIMTTAGLQSKLVDSMILGMQMGNGPPAERFAPRRSKLDDLANDVTRLLIPDCRKFKLAHSKIRFHRFPNLVIDRRGFTQILLNLGKNAIKYADPNRPEEFEFIASSELIQADELPSTGVPETYLRRAEKLGIRRGHLFSFQDRGVGISTGYTDRVFDAGVRDTANELVASRFGAGLGLAVVRSIVRDHFGEIWVEQAGGPTIFQLFLPDLLDTDRYLDHPEWTTTNGQYGRE
ncbi:MAG: sensor histidine kinase [Pseudomonadota bacterium]